MAAKIFSVKNPKTGAVERLVKANNKSQVNKFLQTLVVIEAVGAVDVAEMVMKGQFAIYDATESDDGAAGASGPAVGASDAASAAGASDPAVGASDAASAADSAANAGANEGHARAEPQAA